MFKDPVCGMEVDERKALKAEKDGKAYYFCSDNCRAKFFGKSPEGVQAKPQGSATAKTTIGITGMHCARYGGRDNR